jgi:hypothetical protein
MHRLQHCAKMLPDGVGTVLVTLTTVPCPTVKRVVLLNKDPQWKHKRHPDDDLRAGVGDGDAFYELFLNSNVFFWVWQRRPRMYYVVSIYMSATVLFFKLPGQLYYNSSQKVVYLKLAHACCAMSVLLQQHIFLKFV